MSTEEEKIFSVPPWCVSCPPSARICVRKFKKSRRQLWKEDRQVMQDFVKSHAICENQIFFVTPTSEVLMDEIVQVGYCFQV